MREPERGASASSTHLPPFSFGLQHCILLGSYGCSLLIFDATGTGTPRAARLSWVLLTGGSLWRGAAGSDSGPGNPGQVRPEDFNVLRGGASCCNLVDSTLQSAMNSRPQMGRCAVLSGLGAHTELLLCSTRCRTCCSG